MKKIILFGKGQMAEIAHTYLVHDSDFEVAGFTVDQNCMSGNSFRGLPVIPFEEVSERMPPEQYKMFVPIGAKKMNRLRAEKYFQAKKMGYEFISYIHSSVHVWPETSFGENCFIFEENVIQPFASIGNNVVLWSGNHIGHHSEIGDHCFIASHVVVSGRVVVEPYCYFGVNSTIRDGITIKKACVIGAGALILRDTEENQVFLGPKPKLHALSSDEVKVA
jgi:sugar O-acyltransferase (sialic acid O-acetyltransferase NeuD family)